MPLDEYKNGLIFSWISNQKITIVNMLVDSLWCTDNKQTNAQNLSEVSIYEAVSKKMLLGIT